MKQTISDRLDDLQNCISTLKSSVQTAQRETAEQVEARVTKAQADAKAAQEQVAVDVREASDDTANSWSALRQDMKERMSAVHARVQARKRQTDAKVAKLDADGAEDDAIEALAFAKWAVDNASVTVLNAVKVRLWAAGQAAKV